MILSRIQLESVMSAAASAANTNPTPAPTYCSNIEQACTTAGFRKFGHKADNGLWKMCMEPILNGKTVDKVTVDPVDVKGCQQLRASKK